MPSTQEIVWLSGLLEGEGCFTTNGPKRAIKIALCMSDRDVVEKAARIWGAKTYSRKYRTGHKPLFQTTVYSHRAVGWMMTLYQFMGERRKSRIRELLALWRGRL